jgi:hypothetical protein
VKRYWTLWVKDAKGWYPYYVSTLTNVRAEERRIREIGVRETKIYCGKYLTPKKLVMG